MNKPASYSHGFDITPSNSTDFGRQCEGIYIGSIAGGATMVVVMASGAVLTMTNLIAGKIYELKAKRVNSTGTTASGLIAFGPIG